MYTEWISGFTADTSYNEESHYNTFCSLYSTDFIFIIIIIVIIISLTFVFFQDQSRVWTAATQQHWDFKTVIMINAYIKNKSFFECA